MNYRHLLAAGLLTFASLGSAHAITTVTLAAGSGWQGFVIDPPSQSIPGTPLAWHTLDTTGDIAFSITVNSGEYGTLLVTDSGYAGNVFSVTADGLSLGNTSAATNDANSVNGVFDYAAAFADPTFSHGTYGFGQGTYIITGALFSSAVDASGVAFNSTIGGVNFTVTAVPEASTLAMLMAGLGLVGLLARRRAV
jgi:hypothetical protein